MNKYDTLIIPKDRSGAAGGFQLPAREREI